MQPCLSIILPVYKVELYIREALLSCIDQSLSSEEYEVIIVDDGSPDGSAAIIKELLPQIPNAHYIYQDNRGISEARNTGLKKASGEYVWFVDSDDYIAPDCLSTLKQRLLETDYPDMLALSGVEFVQNGGSHPSIQYEEDQEAQAGVEHLAMPSVFMAVHHYLFRRAFLERHALTFYPSITHEDEEFLSRTLYFAPRIAYYSQPVYYYRRREGSITASYNPLRVQHLLTVASSLASFADSHPHPALWGRIDVVVQVALGLCYRNNDKKNALHFLKAFWQRDELKKYLNRTKNLKVKGLFAVIRITNPVLGWVLFVLQQRLFGKMRP